MHFDSCFRALSGWVLVLFCVGFATFGSSIITGITYLFINNSRAMISLLIFTVSSLVELN